MSTNQTIKKERYFHLDIAKFVLVFSFMLAHFFPHEMGISVYWNTGGFVLMSGYIAGILLPKKPLNFAYGAVKFLKINLWLVVYFLLIYAMYGLIGKADVAFGVTTSYMSVFEYIALFYLLVPFLGLVERKGLISLLVVLAIVIVNYTVFYSGKPESPIIGFLTNLFLLGGKSPYSHYPLLGFVNIGLVGFLFGMAEKAIPFKKYVMVFIVIVCCILNHLNESTAISVWTARYPPLMFYMFFSLAVFSLLLDASGLLSRSFSNSFVSKIITDTAKYSIIIFAIHKPVFIILRKCNVHELMFGKYFPDLVQSIVIVVIVNIAFCYAIDNVVRRLPKRVVKIIL